MTWIHSDLCFLFVERLEEDKVLMASIGEMIQEIKDASRKGTIYGLVFSLAYCSVVRLDVGGGGHVTF